MLIDLNYARDTTSGAEGLDLLKQIQQLDAALPVVVMTAWGSVNLAVEAMRRGARDFVEKPWNNERLQAIITTQVELGARHPPGRSTRGAQPQSGDGEALAGLIADAPAMQPVLQMIARVGPSDANVLITGENGTGKSLVARALHAVSPRASRPMVTINAGGVSEGVFESELFGHVKGAFTDARRTAWDGSSWPTAARCSSTRSPTCRSASSRSCCGCSRPANSSGWARRAPAAPTCG